MPGLVPQHVAMVNIPLATAFLLAFVLLDIAIFIRAATSWNEWGEDIFTLVVGFLSFLSIIPTF